MSCKHSRTHSEHIPALGGIAPPIREVRCRLKERGQLEQLHVYNTLRQLGLERSMITNICPVAHNGRWERCPLRET